MVLRRIGKRAGHVFVDEAERPAEQVDAGGDDRRTNPAIVEHERLDEIVDVAAMIGCVNDAVMLRGVDREADVLADALDLSQDRVQRIFERAIKLVALRRPQFFEIRDDALASGGASQTVTARQIPRHFLMGEDGLGEFIHQTLGL